MLSSNFNCISCNLKVIFKAIKVQDRHLTLNDIERSNQDHRPFNVLCLINNAI